MECMGSSGAMLLQELHREPWLQHSPWQPCDAAQMTQVMGFPSQQPVTDLRVWRQLIFQAPEMVSPLSPFLFFFAGPRGIWKRLI